MESCDLSSLSPVLLIEVLSFLTHSSENLAFFGTLCRAVHGTIQDERSWQQLCKKFWHATDEHLRDWPTLSPQGLYKALEQWAPAEGYYVFTPAFPWGLLVLVRMYKGYVHADVVRFVPQAGSIGFEEVLVPLFKVTLSEQHPGTVSSGLEASWLTAAEVSSLDASELQAHTAMARLFPSLRIGVTRFFHARRAMRISQQIKEDLDEAESEERRPGSGGLCLSESWESGQMLPTREEAVSHTELMMKDMLSSGAIPCDLALIRGPEDFVPHEPSLPRIRPGLYVGDYGHSFYGQYRTEVLLVDYVTLTHEALRQELSAPSASSGRIFARPLDGDPPALEAVLQLQNDVTLMRGVKQCGDVHVPMGATSFVAVAGPPEASLALAAATAYDLGPPRKVLNRQTNEWEEVIRSWRGFGTLASPGFQYPSWAGGWLVQLRDDTRQGGHNRFGFVWDRNQDAVVLHWIELQDTCPFLQRSWLPVDVR